MRCPACGFENASGIKFCGDCGAPLKVKCPSCGFGNAPGIKFCGECGKSLVEVNKPAPLPDPRSYTPKHLAEKILQSRSALEGERKQVRTASCISVTAVPVSRAAIRHELVDLVRVRSRNPRKEGAVTD